MTTHYNTGYPRAACGRRTDNLTKNKLKVTCISCRRTWIYHKP
jgi:hypothetical protein